MVLRNHFPDEWQLSISSQSCVWELPQCELQITFFREVWFKSLTVPDYFFRSTLLSFFLSSPILLLREIYPAYLFVSAISEEDSLPPERGAFFGGLRNSSMPWFSTQAKTCFQDLYSLCAALLSPISAIPNPASAAS